jgi:hypothetical protein
VAFLRNRRRVQRSPISAALLKTSVWSHDPAFWITLTYVLLGVIWIAWSDRFLAALAPSAEVLTKLQTLKGWFLSAAQVSCCMP